MTFLNDCTATYRAVLDRHESLEGVTHDELLQSLDPAMHILGNICKDIMYHDERILRKVGAANGRAEEIEKGVREGKVLFSAYHQPDFELYQDINRREILIHILGEACLTVTYHAELAAQRRQQ